MTTGMEGDGKSSEGKERSPIKRSKGSLGSLNMITGKNNDLGKTSGAANGVFSQRYKNMQAQIFECLSLCFMLVLHAHYFENSNK